MQIANYPSIPSHTSAVFTKCQGLLARVWRGMNRERVLENQSGLFCNAEEQAFTKDALQLFI